jgi:hypothetical protein
LKKNTKYIQVIKQTSEKINILHKVKLIFGISLLVILVITIVSYIGISFGSSSITDTSGYREIIYTNPDSNFIPLNVSMDKINKLKLEKILQIQERDKQAKIQRIENLFSRYKSPMSGYGELIYNRSTECGGDYRIIVGIAGNESGFGRIPYKLYNPFGYLDGVQYSGWYQSISTLSCRISQRFLAPCHNNITCIEGKYGGPDTPKEQWIRHVSSFVNQL